MQKKYLTEAVFKEDPNEQMTEAFLGLHALNPFITTLSSSRSSMLSGHLSQIISLSNGDEKIVQSGMEKQFGDNTFSKKLENDSRILNIITRYNGIDVNHASETTELTIVFEDLTTGEISTMDIPKYFKLHQYFGFEYNWDLELLNRVATNTVLPAGTILADSPTVTKNKGYKFGVNANMALISLPEVTEDGVIISESFSKRLAYKTYETRTIEFGEDSFPLNIYGDKDNYKSFPEIGDTICDDGVLMVLRDYDTSLSPALTSKRDVMEFDPVFDKCEYIKPGGKYFASVTR